MGGRQSTTTTGAVGGGAGGSNGGGSGGGGRGTSSTTDGVHFSHGHPQHHLQNAAVGVGGGPSSQTQQQQRHRPVSSGALHHHRGFAVSIPASNGGASAAAAGGGGGALGSPGSDDSTPEDDPISRAILGSTIPVHLFSFRDIKCPVCSKLVPPDDVECHFVMCLTRPRINYNEDVLLEDKDECAICFEELLQGETIARLPCLCIYHKSCIDQWFKVKRSCPEHPND